MGWERYVGSDGATLTLEQFGSSGAYKDLAVYFGFTADNVLNRARALLG